MNLVEKLSAILLDGAEPDALLDRYSRQRRAVMTDFVQRQTIRNKQFIEAGTEEAQRLAQLQMEAVLADDARRRDYLLQQSMYNSLRMEAAIP
jgi:3-(3-hydroxy-phenyl)propionate hydroxylase